VSLISKVQIAQRFQRAVKIDADFTNSDSLEGFICPASSLNVIMTMAKHVSETGQCAFTWTGPYGSGKSSLAIAFGSLLNGNAGRRKQAAEIIGKAEAETLWKELPPKSKGWKILPVVGRRESPALVLGEAISKFDSKQHSDEWTDQKVVDALINIANQHPRSSGGLIVFIDEMGKFLEHVSQEGGDIYLFQLLAEQAARSNKRLVIIGILHQAFEEYANKLSREMRDEWSKIQGRFIDLPVNTAGEEQVELISKAIQTEMPTSPSRKIAEQLIQFIRTHRPRTHSGLAKTIEQCWPLHPVVACLLGPISKRRFGQNQRSIFGFLNSAEANGFKDFLEHSDGNDLYTIDRLWDYLRVNLEASILASPDSHRWSLAVEAIGRCEGLDSNNVHIKLIKAIALLDMLKEQSRIYPSIEALKICLHTEKDEEIKTALADLKKWSLIIFRKHANSYSIFAGSDFEIEDAVESKLSEIGDINFEKIKQLADLQPILAKRHFHKTGALRWFDVVLVPLNELQQRINKGLLKSESIGQFILAIPTNDETTEKAAKIIRTAIKSSEDKIAVGLSQKNWLIISLAKELTALEKVESESPELAGDAVARREVRARISLVQNQLENELRKAFDNATWYMKHHSPKVLTHRELNILASTLADNLFREAPIIQSELLNRMKVSSNAASARNILLKLMVQNEGLERLGIEGFPVEGAAFVNVLEKTGLYGRKDGDSYGFLTPKKGDECRLFPLWARTTQFLKDNQDRSVGIDEIYALWKAAPFGLKDGLLPILSVAYIQSQKDCLAYYREGIFQSTFKDIDTEYLTKDPSSIQIRWMDLSEVSRTLLSGMASIVRELDSNNRLENLSPIDVARGLISIFDRLHPWTKKTMRLSANAIKIRNLFKHAHDPNKLLFNDIPALAGKKPKGMSDQKQMDKIISNVREGLTELTEAYPSMLNRLKLIMFEELQVPNESAQSIADLNARAENVKELGGDFRLEAFVMRLSKFSGSTEDMEGIASLVANKPVRTWIDLDLDRAAVAVADFSQKFNRAEAFARVKGRPDKRHSVAVVVGLEGKPEPFIEEFDISEQDASQVKALTAKVNELLGEFAEMKNPKIILAALAEISAEYIQRKSSRAQQP